jgi:hypothetical protein
MKWKYEICQFLMISYKEVVVKNLVSLAHFVMHDA